MYHIVCIASLAIQPPLSRRVRIFSTRHSSWLYVMTCDCSKFQLVQSTLQVPFGFDCCLFIITDGLAVDIITDGLAVVSR